MTQGKSPPAGIGVIVAGGTLSALAHDPFEILDYGQAGSLGARQLIAHYESQDRFRFHPLDFEPVPSFDIGLPQWLRICAMCDDALRGTPDLKGFVLTHGTGALEETAFFLSLLWDLPVPLIVTGAQRPASALGGDGWMNFHQAACVAASGQVTGGVLVVAHGEIHLPADVTKTANFGLDTFRSPDMGPVGQVIGNAVHLLRQEIRPTQRPLADWRNLSVLPRVDLLYCHAEGDAVAIEAFVAAGTQGIVLAGFAPGYATGVQARRLEAWIRQAGGIVVAASRATGPVVSNNRNDGHGFIPAGRHTPAKARLLLQLALAAGLAPRQIATLFSRSQKGT